MPLPALLVMPEIPITSISLKIALAPQTPFKFRDLLELPFFFLPDCELSWAGSGLNGGGGVGREEGVVASRYEVL